MTSLMMCGSKFIDIMKVEPLRMSAQENMYWVSSFHQYCTAQLNRAKLLVDMVKLNISSSITNDPMFYELNNAIFMLGTSLERYCGSLSEYKMVVLESGIKHYYFTEMLHLFNMGALGSLHLCKESLNMTQESSLYYKHNPDLIIIPFINTTKDGGGENSTNTVGYLTRMKVVTFSLLSDEYRYRLVSGCLLVISCVIITLLIVVIAMIRDKKREVHWSRSTSPSSLESENMMPSSSSSELKKQQQQQKPRPQQTTSSSTPKNRKAQVTIGDKKQSNGGDTRNKKKGESDSSYGDMSHLGLDNFDNISSLTTSSDYEI
jgi:hypothetical protein